MKKVLFLILMLTLLVLTISLAEASQVESTQVNAGDKFSGSISIRGGSGNDIDFKVTDPQGTTIVGLGRVSQGRSFEFTATRSGAYSLHLDNSFSFLSSKNVYLSYDIIPAPTPTPAIFGDWIDDNSGISLLTIVTISTVIIGIIVVLIAFVLYQKKSNSNSSQPPLPPPPP